MMRRRYLRKLVPLLGFIACLALLSFATSRPIPTTPSKPQSTPPKQDYLQQPPQDVRNKGQETLLEMKRRFPVVDHDAPESPDSLEREKRRSKGKHYDKANMVGNQPTQYWSILTTHWASGLPALPVNQSSAVLTGQVLKSEAHLSNDKSGVYTEFGLRVDAVLKSDNPTLAHDTLVTVSRTGGVVRWPSGEEELCAIGDQTMPELSKTYLLFLRRIDDTSDYEIITGYEIGTGHVLPLDLAEQFGTYHNVEAASLLSATRNAIAQIR